MRALDPGRLLSALLLTASVPHMPFFPLLGVNVSESQVAGPGHTRGGSLHKRNPEIINLFT